MATIPAWLPALGATALALGACGYPDFQFGTTGGGGSSPTTTSDASSGTTGGGGGAGGAGGTGGATSSSASTGGGGTGGGCPILHPGGGTCEYLKGAECGCAENQKCSVIDQTTGESGCVLIGAQPLPAWSKCNGDTDCAAGTWCDSAFTKTCKPICNGVSDCAPGAQCVDARQKGQNSTIPGLRVCTAQCNPETSAPCGDNVTCTYFSSMTALDCITTLNKAKGAACAFSNDCGKGLVCVLSGQAQQGICEPWCHPADSFTGDGYCWLNHGKDYCNGLGTTIEYEGSKYGTCSD